MRPPPLLRIAKEHSIQGDEYLMSGQGVLTSQNIGIKAKVENKGQYQQYLDELKPLREELGVTLKEDLYPEDGDKISN